MPNVGPSASRAGTNGGQPSPALHRCRFRSRPATAATATTGGGGRAQAQVAACRAGEREGAEREEAGQPVGRGAQRRGALGDEVCDAVQRAQLGAGGDHLQVARRSPRSPSASPAPRSTTGRGVIAGQLRLAQAG